MIPAAEALRLPIAQLSDEERAAADKLEAAIDDRVRGSMRRNGIDFKTDETRSIVIAEVNQRLKSAGWQPQWQALIERHKLNAAQQVHIGFGLALAPTDDAFRAAALLS